LVDNYDPTISGCAAGTIAQVDPYYGEITTCTSVLGTSYTNGTAVLACNPADAACTGCVAANGYFATLAGGCIYCPNLIGSTGVADPNGNGCVCSTNYYWNAATSTCDCDWWNNYVGGPIVQCIDCRIVLETTSQATPDGCGCVTGWWNSLKDKCQVNCDLNTSI
jgi:hypothetical protein